MISNVVLEKMDANMEEATLGAWRVEEGAVIEAGQPLVELITDKITFDYDAPVGGTVRRLLAAPGSVMPVGFVMAQIGDADTELPEVDEQNRALQEAHRKRQEVQIEAPPRRAAAAKADGGGRVRATPAARRLAREHGIELSAVDTAEPGGIVSEADVRAYLDRRD